MDKIFRQREWVAKLAKIFAYTVPLIPCACMSNLNNSFATVNQLANLFIKSEVSCI